MQDADAITILDPEEQLRSIFISQKQKEFEKFVAGIVSEDRASGLNRMHRDRIADQIVKHSFTKEFVSTLASVNFGSAIVRYTRANNCSATGFLHSASELLAYDLLARHADEILKASEEELQQTRNNYRDFIELNKPLLQRLNLPTDTD